MGILFGVVVACSDASNAPPRTTAENAERVVHDHYRLWYRDFDRDGHGDPTVITRGLTRPLGYVANATDCNDQSAAISPTAPEQCANNDDDDCDGDRDEDCAISLAEADFFVDIDEEDAMLGERMASGDLDADGTADLAIGATRRLGVGSVYLLYGPASGSVVADDLVSVSASRGDAPTTVSYFGSAVGAGDANGDALDDLLVAAVYSDEYYLFLGPITADRSTRDADAEFVADLYPDPPCVDITRDLDGDGGADLVMTSPYVMRVYVVSGTASGTLELPSDATYTFTDGPYSSDMGLAMAEMGDTNGDGIAELALGAPYVWPPRVYVVAGGAAPGSYHAPDVATATFRTSERTNPSYYLGISVASGDYDGDGTADLFAGGWGSNSYSGAVFGFLGPLSGSTLAHDANVRWDGPPVSGLFGSAVAADDFDGDGSLDVAMGARRAATAVFVQSGLATGTVDAASLVQIQGGGYVGDSITPIPDWTGDGGAELALGAPITDGASTEDAGKVYGFFSESLY
jgi:hypothetical protein